MTPDEAPLRPTTETNVLLGRLLEGVAQVKEEQSSSRLEVSALRSELADVKADVAVLKSQQRPAAPWWSIVTGFAGVGALVTVIVQLFAK